MDRLANNPRAKTSLKQRLDFPVEENIKSVYNPRAKNLKIYGYYGSSIIQEQKIVETTVRFSISRKDQNYG